MNTKEKPFLFEDAIALTGHGKFHYMLLTCCGLCLTSVITSTLNTSYLLPSAACDFSMTAQDKGLLNAMCYIGMVFSSHLWGYIADTRGRKKVVITGLLLDSTCSIIGSFSHAYWFFVLVRFFNGFSVSAAGAVNYAYLGEFHPSSTRTKAIMLCGVFVSVATIMLPGIAWLVIPQPWSFQLPAYTYNSWRVLVVLSAVPGFITAILYSFLPESPKFLLGQRKESECLIILNKMYTLNTGERAESYPVKSVTLVEESSEQTNIHQHDHRTSGSLGAIVQDVWQQTAPLFKPPHHLYTAICYIMMMCFFSASNGLFLWLPEIFNNLSKFSFVHPEEPASICLAYAQPNDMFGVAAASNITNYDVSSSTQYSMDTLNTTSACSSSITPETFQNTIIVGTASGAMYFVAGYLIDIIGKKTMLGIALLLVASCALALDFVSSSSAVLALSCIIVSVLFTCISVLSVFIVEIFPTHLRAMAVSLSLMVGRIGTVSGSLLIGTLLEINCHAMFFVIGGISLVCAVLSLFLPSQSKRTEVIVI